MTQKHIHVAVTNTERYNGYILDLLHIMRSIRIFKKRKNNFHTALNEIRILTSRLTTKPRTCLLFCAWNKQTIDE